MHLVVDPSRTVLTNQSQRHKVYHVVGATQAAVKLILLDLRVAIALVVLITEVKLCVLFRCLNMIAFYEK